MISTDRIKDNDNEIPMGVSAWRNHGQKWGYWEFFVKEMLNEIKQGKMCMNCGGEKESNLTDLCGKCLEEE